MVRRKPGDATDLTGSVCLGLLHTHIRVSGGGTAAFFARSDEEEDAKPITPSVTFFSRFPI